MGHAETIHREHYRQPLASRDILKISQYLEAVQGYVQDLDESSSDSEYEENQEDEIKNNNNNDVTTNYTNKENLSLSNYINI